MNMYIGESERNVREIFSQALAARPCVIFFDELDSLAPARGRSSDSGGVSDRVVSTLLACLDALPPSSVFPMGATNRPDLLDTALLRPGRFDRMIFVAPPESAASKQTVLDALTRKFNKEEGFDMLRIAEMLPSGPSVTGADMYGLCSEAWMIAVKRKIREDEEETGSGKSLKAGEKADIDSDDEDENLSGEVVVKMSDFVAAVEHLSPSLSAAEIKRYYKLRDEIEGKR
mmetsp:Transcript_16392/g.42289  ORF Transcript_16392/g.42289 Transcript_16392/m.42289 type:complete len:230 (-) Transcript_16392:173-862(-)